MDNPEAPVAGEELVEALRSSKEALGPIYPILVTPDGNVIDGVHRIKADPNWPKYTVALKDPADADAVRTAVNWIRRTMTPQEKAQSLATITKRTGATPKELAEKLGLSYRTVMRDLPDELKRAGGYEHPPKKRIDRVAIQPEEPVARPAPREKKPRVTFMGRPVAEAAELMRTKAGREALTAPRPETPTRKPLEPTTPKMQLKKCPLCGSRVLGQKLQLKYEEFSRVPEITVKELFEARR